MKPEELRNPTIDSAREEHTRGWQRMDAIDRAAAELKGNRERHEARVAEIEEHLLPLKMAGLLLGEVDPDEVSALKDELRWKKEALQLDIPKGFKGLEDLRHTELVKVRQLKMSILDKIPAFLERVNLAAKGDERALSFAADMAPALGVSEAQMEEIRQGFAQQETE